MFQRALAMLVAAAVVITTQIPLEAASDALVRFPSPSIRWKNLPGPETPESLPELTSRREFQQHAEWLRGRARFAVGLFPEIPRSPIRVVQGPRQVFHDVTVTPVGIEVMENWWVVGTYFRAAPEASAQPVAGESTARAGETPDESKPAGRGQVLFLYAGDHAGQDAASAGSEDFGSIVTRCLSLARSGVDVFACPQQTRPVTPDGSPEARRAAVWGVSCLGINTLNNLYVVDHLARPPVRRDAGSDQPAPRRPIGVTGTAAAEVPTLALAVIDRRVDAVVLNRSASNRAKPCSQAPTLRIDTGDIELTSTLAPRPLLMIQHPGDSADRTAELMVERLQKVYELYAEQSHFTHRTVARSAEMTMGLLSAETPFFLRHLGVAGGPARTISPVDDAEARTLLSQRPNETTSGGLEPDKQCALLIDRRKSYIAGITPDTIEGLKTLQHVFQQGLQYACATPSPGRHDVTLFGDPYQPRYQRGWLSKTRIETNTAFTSAVGFKPMPIEVFYLRNQRMVRSLQIAFDGCRRPMGALTICFHPEGMAVAPDMEAMVTESMAQRRPASVVFVEPFGSGRSRPPGKLKTPRGSTAFFTTYNRTDAAETVYDMATALGYLVTEHQHLPRVNIVGFGEMGPLALAARTILSKVITLDPQVRTVVDLQQWDITAEETYLDACFIPGIERIGGLKAALAAAAEDGPVWVYNVPENFPEEWLTAAGRRQDIRTRVTRETPAAADIPIWLKELLVN